jgi:hypothetical protein
MKIRRLLLFILVALNLTLVCQGHAVGGGHTGVHLALLSEPHNETEEEDAPAEIPGEEVEGLHEPAHVVTQVAGETHPTNLPAQEVGRNSDPAVLSGDGHLTGLSSLAVAFLGIFAGAAHIFSFYWVSRVAWGLNSRRPPEPPPPRFSHVTV